MDGTDLHFCWSAKRKSGTDRLSVNTDSQWSEQEACFARATQKWLAVNHNSVTSGEFIRFSKRIVQTSKFVNCQSN